MTKKHHQRPFLVQPSAIIMVLLLCGVTALFGALSFAYLYTRVDKGMQSIRLPWLFILNTFILAASSLSIHLCRKYFDQKNEKLILRYGFLTVAFTLLFLTMQAIVWRQLLVQQLLPGSSGGHGYLYAISVLHFLHVFAGLPFLLRIILPLNSAYKEGTSALYFLSEEQRSRLKYTSWYWHFIDVMWVYLVVFFLMNSLITG